MFVNVNLQLCLNFQDGTVETEEKVPLDLEACLDQKVCKAS